MTIVVIQYVNASFYKYIIHYRRYIIKLRQWARDAFEFKHSYLKIIKERKTIKITIFIGEQFRMSLVILMHYLSIFFPFN